MFDFSEKLNLIWNSLTADFADYTKLLKACTLIGPQRASNDLKLLFKRIYFAYFTFINRPSAFNDAEQLNEVDRLHMKFFDSNSDDLDFFVGDEWRDRCR